MRNRRDKFARAGEQSQIPYPLTKHSLINGVQVFRDFLNEKFCFFAPDSRRQEVPDTNYSALYPKVNYLWPSNPPPVVQDLYYTNAGGDYYWDNLLNWNTKPDGTGENPLGVPWTDDGNGGAWYANSDLIDSTGGNSSAFIQSIIDPNAVVTGICDIQILAGVGPYGTAQIYGGTFSADYSTIDSYIYGGLFTGGYLSNFGTIYNGTFTGNFFSNQYAGVGAGIYGGIFTGYDFSNVFTTFSNAVCSGDGFFNNGGYVFGGSLLTGNYVTNGGGSQISYSGDPIPPVFTGYSFTNDGFLANGVFEIDGFTNNGSIDYQKITITQNGTPYTGVWQGQVWSDGVWVSVAPLYYTNASGDGTWENLQNWNFAADGSGDNPIGVPWADDGNGGALYKDSNLIDVSGIYGISVNSYIDPNQVVTGSCDAVVVLYSGNIYGGTFTAPLNIQFGSVSGGTFTAEGCFNESGYIYGGVFSGNYFVSYSDIDGGVFTGSWFANYGAIHAGSFNIDEFTNDGTIDYPSVTINLDGVPYTGTWDGQNWVDGVYTP